MSAAEHAEPHHEIIIIRHGGHDDHDDHHGGAWKIAFADFMTAMMCFFLVMWLINAANEETKAAVASYFNPIKLTDKNASRRGLDDDGAGATSAQTQAQSEMDPAAATSTSGAAATGNMKQSVSSESADSTKYTDENLFSNPYAVLAEIAAETGMMQNMSEKGDGGAQLSGPATGASGGESFRDPFAPDFWSEEIVPGVESPPTDEESALTEVGDADKPGQASGAAKEGAETGGASKQATDAAADEAPAPAEKMQAKDKQAKSEPKTELPKVEKAAEKADEAPEKPVDPLQPSEAVQREAAEIRREIAKALGKDEKLAGGLSVEATTDGVMISVTDQLDFGMFEIGSAVPRRDLVLAMEKIGRILSGRNGSIHVNGHTDARPFAGGNYDNWRLSTARAHSAYYMLVRSGLDEKRLTEVAGFADRKLKVTDDPYAAANRRIEILLETAG